MLYELLANLILVIHLAFVLFVLFGGLLLFRWPRLCWFHLPAVLWGVGIELIGWICPLTPLENSFHQLAGRSGYSGGFVEHYLLPLLYPATLTPYIQLYMGLFVIIVNVGIYALLHRYRRSSR
jgi:hypothetical protein